MGYLITKRIFDALVSAMGLLITAPLVAVIALAVKVDSRGPVFYTSDRVGRGGNLFRLLKFRTMVVGADSSGVSSTPDDDARITRVGKILRSLKLDELPELINVLRGDMSLVGPRPQVQWAVELYSSEERAALSVRPGIADYAFVMLPSEGEVLRGSSDPDKDYFDKVHPQKMKLTLEYVNTRSFSLDVKVLVDTAMLSFFGKVIFLRAARGV